MATVVWPVGLPQSPKQREFRERFPDTVVRTAMDVGPAKVRQRLTTNVTLVDIELRLTRTQCATLRAFFLDSVKGGALPFDWKDHRTGDDCEYRFVGQPDIRPLAPRQGGSEFWAATFTLEMLPAQAGGTPPDPPENFLGGGEFFAELLVSETEAPERDESEEFDAIDYLLVATPPVIPTSVWGEPVFGEDEPDEVRSADFREELDEFVPITAEEAVLSQPGSFISVGAE